MIVRSNELGVRRHMMNNEKFESHKRVNDPLRSHQKYSKLRTPNSELLLKNKGFTLIEIIILIVMAGILLPAIIIPFATGIKGSTKPEMVTTAMYLAHQRMEELMKFDYSKTPELDPTALTAPAAAPIAGYQWQWSIYYVDNSFLNPDLVTNRGYKQIRVLITDPVGDTYNVYSVVTDFP